jgi:hypothetical protein
MKYCCVIIIGLIFFSCKKESAGQKENVVQDVSVTLNNCISLSTITNPNFSICYDSLVRDSRCSEPVLCIWKGEVTVKLLFKQSNNIIPFRLSDSPNIIGNAPSDTTINGVNIKLIDVLPYRFINQNGEKKVVLQIN